MCVCVCDLEFVKIRELNKFRGGSEATAKEKVVERKEEQRGGKVVMNFSNAQGV